MNIGVVGYINPCEFSEYLPECDVFEDNISATAVNTLVKEFLRQGHNVCVFSACSRGKSEYHFIGRHLQIHMVGIEKPIKFTSFFVQFYMTYRMKKLIKPHINKLDVLHAHWTYFYALAAKSFSRQKPVFCTVRDWAPYIYSTRKGLEAKFGWWINLLVFKMVMNSKAVHFIANSDYTLNCIKTAYPEKESILIYNPVDSRFILDDRIYEKREPIFITISQSIDDSRKNIITLVKAFKDYQLERKDARLIIVGRYSQNNPIIDYINRNDIHNVELTGNLTHDDVISKIDQSTCLVHPAFEETFGNILIEAMARRIPCIGGCKSGGVPIVLGDGKYGLVCDISDHEAILVAMKKITNNRYVDDLVNNATEMLREKFSSDAICKKHIELYNKYLKHKNLIYDRAAQIYS